MIQQNETTASLSQPSIYKRQIEALSKELETSRRLNEQLLQLRKDDVVANNNKLLESSKKKQVDALKRQDNLLNKSNKSKSRKPGTTNINKTATTKPVSTELTTTVQTPTVPTPTVPTPIPKPTVPIPTIPMPTVPTPTIPTPTVPTTTVPTPTVQTAVVHLQSDWEIEHDISKPYLDFESPDYDPYTSEMVSIVNVRKRKLEPAELLVKWTCGCYEWGTIDNVWKDVYGWDKKRKMFHEYNNSHGLSLVQNFIESKSKKTKK
jgi:hypothetical protein